MLMRDHNTNFRNSAARLWQGSAAHRLSYYLIAVLSVVVELIVGRVHPDDRAAVQKTIDDASRDGEDFDHEYRLLMPDGSVKHVHAVARAVQDASGSIEFLGAITDVTAAREAEQKLRRSEAYLAEAGMSRVLLNF